MISFLCRILSFPCLNNGSNRNEFFFRSPKARVWFSPWYREMIFSFSICRSFLSVGWLLVFTWIGIMQADLRAKPIQVRTNAWGNLLSHSFTLVKTFCNIPKLAKHEHTKTLKILGPNESQFLLDDKVRWTESEEDDESFSFCISLPSISNTSGVKERREKSMIDLHDPPLLI